MFSELLSNALDLQAGQTPFAWQRRLYDELLAGRLPRALDLPTGLGKTSVMALWLLALASGAKLPRRLVYVVDRRAVVDQATRVAEGLRAFVAANPQLGAGLGLDEGRALPISTLRGQFVDNRAWLEDPASAAIIVGTVDMVGSRLLFGGYGVSRKMRPYHAGLLSNDALVVLDEAHLVPPFERLVSAIADGQTQFGPRGPDAPVRPLALLSLSATGRTSDSRSFELREDEIEGVVAKRLTAVKRVTIAELESGQKLPDALAKAALALADANGPVRCIVFCNARQDADKAAEAIMASAKKAGASEVAVELLVGGRRVREREAAAASLEALGFIAGKKGERTAPAFLVATAAGEVGVDLDADHMVSDLVAWERMVQRLGRVNRRGEGAAEVQVVIADPEAVATQRAALVALPRNVETDTYDGSPAAIRALKLQAKSDPTLAAKLAAATTPAPLYPPLVRPLVEAWAMTSLETNAGRPIVAPWLRGWVDPDVQTTIVWRQHLPRRQDGQAGAKKETAAFFEAAPVHLSETLQAETWRVLQWLIARAEAAKQRTKTAGSETIAAGDGDAAAAIAPIALDAVVAFIDAGDGDWQPRTLAQLVPHKGDNRAKEQLERLVSDATVVLDARLGGLSANGLLNDGADDAVTTADGDGVWLAKSSAAETVGFRVRELRLTDDSATSAPNWQERARFVVQRTPTGEPLRVLAVEKWRQAVMEEDRSLMKRNQSLAQHQSWAELRASSLARRLGLGRDSASALALAAKLHDEGKRAARWQEAFNAPKDGVYAKTRGPINQARLDGYRHELGSFLDAREHPEVAALTPELRDLVLHLIVSHHGYARPVIGLAGVDRRPPTLLRGDADEIAERFARLTEVWGPWGLAWWEAVLRAADQQASRDNEDEASAPNSGEA